MSKNKQIVIGVIVAAVLFLGLGLLHWGSMVYWASGGQRGFSAGAATYQMMGWGAENYLADMSFRSGAQLVDSNEDGVPDRGMIAPSGQDRFHKVGPHGFDGGFGRSHRGPGCFFLLLVLGAIGGGIYYYRRRKASASTNA